MTSNNGGLAHRDPRQLEHQSHPRKLDVCRTSIVRNSEALAVCRTPSAPKNRFRFSDLMTPSQCPLLGVKRTYLFALQMSAFDPKADMPITSINAHFSKKQTWTATITRRRDLDHSFVTPSRAVLKIGPHPVLCPSCLIEMWSARVRLLAPDARKVRFGGTKEEYIVQVICVKEN